MPRMTSRGQDPAPLLQLDKLNWEQIERQWYTTQHDEKAPSPGQHLHCAHCDAPITDPEQRIAIQGRHEHTFMNPHELMFHIGCFAAAPGCAQVDIATAEWTWFSGYRWQVALCRHCGIHLGWRYRGAGSDAFFGLILDRLVLHKDH